MKKIKIDFEDNLSPAMLKTIGMIYRDGFEESDVISFSEIDEALEDRMKVFFKDTLFLIKRSVISDVLTGKYSEDILTPTKTDHEICEGEYCEN